jgi:hypothetical protein
MSRVGNVVELFACPSPRGRLCAGWWRQSRWGAAVKACFAGSRAGKKRSPLRPGGGFSSSCHHRQPSRASRHHGADRRGITASRHHHAVSVERASGITAFQKISDGHAKAIRRRSSGPPALGYQTACSPGQRRRRRHAAIRRAIARSPTGPNQVRPQPQRTPKRQVVKLGPIRARRVSEGLSFFQQKSKKPFIFGHFRRFQQAEKPLDFKTCGPDAPTLASSS